MSVSSVKNLNGETFSAVQDLELTNFVQTNSGSWTGCDVTSPLGTISVDGSNIEATNSAVGNILIPSTSALLGEGVSIWGTIDAPTLFNFTLPTSGGTLYAVRTEFSLTTNSFNFSGKDLNGNIVTGTMTYPGEIGTYTADLNEIVSNITAQNNAPGPVYVNQLYVTSPETSSIGVKELAWKSDIPTGIMVESACEYNAVNEISGYNGSAIAQYGAEKQWLQHDDTIVHVANSAQYAFGVNLSAVAQLLGVDETVLYSGNRTQSAVLSDSIWNYNRIGIYAGANGQNISNYQIFDTVDISSNGNIIMMQNTFNFEGASYYSFVTNYSALYNGTTLYSVGADGIAVNTAVEIFKDNKNLGCIKKVIGIGRKA